MEWGPDKRKRGRPQFKEIDEEDSEVTTGEEGRNVERLSGVWVLVGVQEGDRGEEG